MVTSTAALTAAKTSRRPELLTVGTVVWLASELMFFSGLFAAYFTLRAQSPVWPPPGVELDTVAATLATILLVASSGTMQLGVKAVARGDRTAYMRWLAVTFVLGAVFVLAQARDWARLHFSIGSHAYGSAFYLMTGFHGLHVIGGLLAMMVMGGRAASRRFGADDLPSAEMLSYYWHFVDIVWIGLWATIFFIR
ncbi:MAG: cytochrome c oxidase subunit [Acidimicrobiaceae bacterium]|jgi:cytochrome c oxidase subunit 3|nr:cytochrome c oxidase subunit [Acidimicrobiaceae bacterium]MDQ1366529.1 cytochrome c oxidase subunit [Acidimicrobiaceae bacterium]MDQ1376665.1 cytochrome c oxidase subunit [Acidimicrobiaceae bacterium]MDQ1413010.1 cytochrome c oxidase subunit [Acidimicrobiaceae bacterium]MDQ1440227.1 cytochrome c oxidase subunit [Acidimicrobiaceae bacterium]